VEIYLLRASLTAQLGQDAATAPEAHRYLSLEGRQLVRALGNKIRLTEEPSFTRVVASPLPAALQTAELFADRVDYVGIIEAMPALASGVPPQVLAPLLLASEGAVLVVGDEPALSALGAFLIGRATFPPLAHAQVSVIRDRQPAWCLRPGDLGKQLLLVS
jgi:phosphohistidine phosphatase SixA